MLKAHRLIESDCVRRILLAAITSGLHCEVADQTLTMPFLRPTRCVYAGSWGSYCNLAMQQLLHPESEWVPIPKSETFGLQTFRK